MQIMPSEGAGEGMKDYTQTRILRCHNCHTNQFHTRITAIDGTPKWRCHNCLIVAETLQSALGTFPIDS